MLHILGVSESRLTGSGRQTMTTGETVLYSGLKDNHHHEGVAMILRKGMEKSLLQWKPVSSCLRRARLRGRHTNITLIQCYASTNDSKFLQRRILLAAHLWKVPSSCQHHHQRQARIPADDKESKRSVGQNILERF